ncbi:receptor-transporting protein 3 [Xenopus laevis]|uniref:Receptor-transporting protein 3 n=2 Tax=Xenopus laevis TaxID=8355 RepID=A0A1L8GAA5_XENLA|nr:receptor-transporting protein 3 [Xenopus laevis]XP_041418312.1 receptor-transporting protein 3 [Xenopus laevis]OCT80656.1 hypothetical protein XELAEV_18027469mg [Xenopus laevis]
MEQRNWKSLFKDELERISAPHEWDFILDNTLQKQLAWLVYIPCTFGRFHCSSCNRLWHSARVHLLFLMMLDKVRRCGTVKMRIFKQKCRRCTSADMEEPEISQENIRIVIGNLVNRIQSKIYLKNNWNQDRKPLVIDNFIEGPHNKEHCEACQANVCPISMLNMDRSIPGNSIGLYLILPAVFFIICFIIHFITNI